MNQSDEYYSNHCVCVSVCCHSRLAQILAQHHCAQLSIFVIIGCTSRDIGWKRARG